MLNSISWTTTFNSHQRQISSSRTRRAANFNSLTQRKITASGDRRDSTTPPTTSSSDQIRFIFRPARALWRISVMSLHVEWVHVFRCAVLSVDRSTIIVWRDGGSVDVYCARQKKLRKFKRNLFERDFRRHRKANLERRSIRCLFFEHPRRSSSSLTRRRHRYRRSRLRRPNTESSKLTFCRILWLHRRDLTRLRMAQPISQWRLRQWKWRHHRSIRWSDAHHFEA